MKRLLFFVNPNAGHAEIRNSLMQVIQIFTDGGYEVTVHPTAGPKDLTRQIAQRGADYDLIVCTGGDGTLNEATSGLMQLKNRPPLGYIPGGTVNDVAASLGLSHNPVEAAQDIVHGHPFPIDIGAFGPERWFDYVAAFGLFTNVPYETPQADKRVWGRLAYFFNGVQALNDVRPVHARVSWDGQTVEADLIDGLVCSTTSVGGFRAERVVDELGISLNDGLYEVVLIRDIKNLADFSAVAAKVLRMDFQNDEYFITCQTSSIRFEFDEPVAWTLDGEFGGSVHEVDIRNHTRAIKMIVPH